MASAKDKRLQLLQAEKLRRQGKDVLAGLSDLNPEQKRFIEAILAGHDVQLMCSRRAGKSYGICLALARYLSRRKSNGIYIGLVKPTVFRAVWTEIWLPLMAQYFPEAKNTDMFTVFPNGSTVFFCGSDDLRFITTQLGASLGIAIVDECQDQDPGVFTKLVDEILPPALSDDKGFGSGVLVTSGTLPKTPAGPWWERWKAESTVQKFRWSRMTNGYIKFQEQALDKFLATRPNLTRQSPIIQRDWYAEEVFDSNERAFWGFSNANLYDGQPPDCQHYSGAIDMGGRDRTAVIVLGWNDWSDQVWVVAEFCTKRNAKLSYSELGKVVVDFDNRYHPFEWVFDSTADMVLDTFLSDFGVLVIKPASKASRKPQIDRLNDLMAQVSKHEPTQRRFMLPRGSELQTDFERAEFDPKTIPTGTYAWSNRYHPDPADCARYALAAYWSSYKPQPELTDLEARRQRIRREIEEMQTKDPLEQIYQDPYAGFDFGGN